MLSNPQTIAFWCTIFLMLFSTLSLALSRFCLFFLIQQLYFCVLWCLTAEMWKKYEYFWNEFLIGFWRHTYIAGRWFVRICVKDEDEKWDCKIVFMHHHRPFTIRKHTKLPVFRTRKKNARRINLIDLLLYFKGNGRQFLWSYCRYIWSDKMHLKLTFLRRWYTGVGRIEKELHVPTQLYGENFFFSFFFFAYVFRMYATTFEVDLLK